MAAEIIGIDKIIKYINKFDFRQIKLSRSTEIVYTRKLKENESQVDLVEDFSEWVNDFIEPNNFRDYKLELFGSYNPDINAKLSPVVKTLVSFNTRSETRVAGANFDNAAPSYKSAPIDVERYIAVASENAALRSQLERMEEKMDELLTDDDDDDVGAIQNPTFTEAISNSLIGKIDTIVDVVLGMMANKNKNITQAINGVDSCEDTLIEFRKIHPDIDADIVRIYNLAIKQPQFFKMLITQLRSME